MQGATFDFANLIGTVFNNVDLSSESNLKPTSFAFSMMQSTEFIGTTSLFASNLTNAAFALKNGVPLFEMNQSHVSELDNGQITVSIKDIFLNRGYPLLWHEDDDKPIATISVVTPGSEWTINNVDDHNTIQTGYGYFRLKLIDNSNGNKIIQIYAYRSIFVLIVDSKGQFQRRELAFGPTGLKQTQMNDNTTCPSGMKFKYLGTHLSFTEIMTAAMPPKPPSDW